MKPSILHSLFTRKNHQLKNPRSLPVTTSILTTGKMILDDLPAEVLAMIAALLADEATPLTISRRWDSSDGKSTSTVYERFQYPEDKTSGLQNQQNPASVSRLGLRMLSDTLCKEYEYRVYYKSLVVFDDPMTLTMYYDEERLEGKPAVMRKRCSVQHIDELSMEL